MFGLTSAKKPSPDVMRVRKLPNDPQSAYSAVSGFYREMHLVQSSVLVC